MPGKKPTFVYFDRVKKEFEGLDEAVMAQLKDVYADINIDKELKKMALWLVNKGKTRVGNMGFIMNWLNKATPSPPSITRPLDMLEYNPLGALYFEYRKELWKDKEHILEFNMITRPL